MAAPAQAKLFDRRPEPIRTEPARCPHCGGFGVVRLDGRRRAASALEIHADLAAGTAVLCTCDMGQWWISTIDDFCADKPGPALTLGGRPKPDRGVPDTLRRGAAGEQWMRDWMQRQEKLSRRGGIS